MIKKKHDNELLSSTRNSSSPCTSKSSEMIQHKSDDERLLDNTSLKKACRIENNSNLISKEILSISNPNNDNAARTRRY